MYLVLLDETGDSKAEILRSDAYREVSFPFNWER